MRTVLIPVGKLVINERSGLVICWRGPLVQRPLPLYIVPIEGGRHTNVSLFQRFCQGYIDFVRLECFPTLMPQHEAIRIVKIDMHVPFDICQPFYLEDVELADWDAANFGPGPILKGIIIQKFGTKHQSCGKHAVYLSTPMIVFATIRQQSHPLGKVVKTKQDGRAGQSRR